MSEAEAVHIIEVEDDLGWMDAPAFSPPTALQRLILNEAVEAVARGETVVFLRDGQEIQRMRPPPNPTLR